MLKVGHITTICRLWWLKLSYRVTPKAGNNGDVSPFDHDTGADEDDSDDILPFDHGHGPWERNPPELTKLTLAFYLGKLFPEHWGDYDGDSGDVSDDDNDDDQDESYFTLYNIIHHDVYDVCITN